METSRYNRNGGIMFEIVKKLAEQVQEQQKDIVFLHKTVLEILDIIKEIQKELDEIKETQKEK